MAGAVEAVRGRVVPLMLLPPALVGELGMMAPAGAGACLPAGGVVTLRRAGASAGKMWPEWPDWHEWLKWLKLPEWLEWPK